MSLPLGNLPVRALAIVAAAFGVGVIAYLAFGASPATVVPAPPAEVDWHPLDARVPDLSVADASWEKYTPWGAPPKPTVEAEPPPVPPIPVGVTRGEKGPEAIFMIAGAGELRLPPGGQLPDGGRVVQVSGLRVSWVDGNGQQHEREMFQPAPAGSISAASTPRSAGTTPADSSTSSADKREPRRRRRPEQR